MALPRTRGECMDGPRPCPHTTCRYHLSESRNGDSCALDFIDRTSMRNEVGRGEDSKADFIRSMPEDMTATEIVEEGATLGINMGVEYVALVRRRAAKLYDELELQPMATQGEVAEALGTTQAMVSYIEQQAMQKFKVRFDQIRASDLLERSLDRVERVEAQQQADSGVYRIADDNTVHLNVA